MAGLLNSRFSSLFFLISVFNFGVADIDLGDVADKVGSLFSAVEDCRYTCEEEGGQLYLGLSDSSCKLLIIWMNMRLKSMYSISNKLHTHRL